MSATRALGPHSLLLPVLLGAAGVLHLVWPGPFVRVVPAWLPAPGLLVAVSGVALVVGAVGLRVASTRRAAAWGLILLLAAVVPANVEMLRAAYARGASPLVLWLLWGRLPLQPLLAWWVWRDARPERAGAPSGPGAHHLDVNDVVL
jgi:uncharacterized membrane protein